MQPKLPCTDGGMIISSSFFMPELDYFSFSIVYSSCATDYDDDAHCKRYVTVSCLSNHLPFFVFIYTFSTSTPHVKKVL